MKKYDSSYDIYQRHFPATWIKELKLKSKRDIDLGSGLAKTYFNDLRLTYLGKNDTDLKAFINVVSMI